MKLIRSVSLTLFAIALLSLAAVAPVAAASLDKASVELDRLNEATATKHTIYFVATSGVGAGNDILITYPASTFAFGGSYGAVDMELAQGNSGNCATATFTDKTLAATPSGAVWGALYATDTVTFTSGTDTITAGSCVRIRLNTGGAGHTLTNPTVTSNTSYVVVIDTDDDDPAYGAVLIMDDAGTPDGDQVLIQATLVTAISLDLDRATSNCENSTETAPPTGVSLGNLFPGTVRISGTDIHFICVDLGTNSSAGVRLRVRSSRNNAIGGLVNGGTGGFIASATADLTSGIVSNGYGLRVSVLGTPQIGSFAAVTPFNSGTPANVGQLPGLTATPASIVVSTAAALTGLSSRIAIEIAAKADIGNDPGSYTDTLVFSAMINL